MSKLQWDKVGERLYETGVDRCVLFLVGKNAAYEKGVPWNGLTAFNENPSGGEANPFYANNKKYLNIIAAEDFGFGLEAYTYPDEWAACDGSAEIAPGVTAGQQTRKVFGITCRTLIGNDTEGQDHGYKLHLVYGAQASPSQRNHGTVNESPEPTTMSWDATTTPVEVPGFKPTAHLVIDSTKTSAEKMAALEEILYGKDPTSEGGTDGADSRLPLPAEIIELMKDSAISG